MFKVAAFTGGAVIASARFRVRQYLPALARGGISVDEMYSRFSNSPPRQKWLRPLWGCATLADMAPKVLRSHRCDVVLMQREILSTFVTLEPLTRKPRVLDVDDAIFLYRNGTAARRLAGLSDRVICGNNYLANWFSQYNGDITIIPTAVDTARYAPRPECRSRDGSIVIGWIGTAGNLPYLYGIEEALAAVMRVNPRVRVRVVCDLRPAFRHLAADRCEFVKWSEQVEVASIQGMDIGVMPLEDSHWARGKCSFKMLQYMSCGVPVVVSPVGMNADVLALDEVGLGASSVAQWSEALLALVDGEALRARMGAAGRRVVQQSYSIDVLAPRLAQCLRGQS